CKSAPKCTNPKTHGSGEDCLAMDCKEKICATECRTDNQVTHLGSNCVEKDYNEREYAIRAKTASPLTIKGTGSCVKTDVEHNPDFRSNREYNRRTFYDADKSRLKQQNLDSNYAGRF